MANERVQIIDSRFHGGGYAVEATRAIFADERRLARWLEVEVALAICQAELGMIPADAAERIAHCLRLETFDLDRVAAGIGQTGHSLVPLLQEASRACGPYASHFLHYGATTQDIQDTAQSLEMRDVLDVLDERIGELVTRLKRMAMEHRDTLMVGRTHARAGLVTVFGLKVASWMDELLRNAERLKDMRPRVLAAQLFGGVGTMAGFGDRGIQLLRGFARRLGLAVPDVGWHVSRDRVVEFVCGVAIVAGTLARIADEIRLLGRPEFGELHEEFPGSLVGSSTMPAKQNPEQCEQVVVLARLAKAQALISFDSLIQEHERDYRGTRVEWAAVADVSHYTVAAVDFTCSIIDRLEIRSERMSQELSKAAAAVASEALMMKLGAVVGKGHAYALVTDVVKAACNRKRPIYTVAQECPDVACALPAESIRDATDPSKHIGSARLLVDRVVARANHARVARVAPSRDRPPHSIRVQQCCQLKIARQSASPLEADCLRDLNRRGFCVGAELEVGSRVNLEFSFTGLLPPFAVEGRVRRSRPGGKERGPVSEIAFTNMSRGAEKRLALFLNVMARPILKTPPSRILVFAPTPLIERVYEEQLDAWQSRNTSAANELITCGGVSALCTALQSKTFSVALLDVRQENILSNIAGAVPNGLPTLVVCTEAQRGVCEELGSGRFYIQTRPIQYGRLAETMSLLLMARDVEQ